MPYTDEEKQQHYQYLLDTIQFLTNNGRITEDWMEDHKRSIMTYRREYMDDMKYVNSEVKDLKFREAAIDAETLLSKLVNSIIKKGTFDKKQYLMFCQTIIFMVDFLNEHYPEASLEALLSEMKI